MTAHPLPLPSQQPGTDALLQILLDASPTGIAQLFPVLAAGQPEEELTDFRYVRLNPAAQRLLGLPEHPAETLGAPGTPAGLLAFYRTTFLAGTPGAFDLRGTTALGHPYAARVAAQRSGPHLVVSFTEVATEQLFKQLVDQVPLAVCVVRGPAYQFDYTNPAFESLFSGRQLVGRTVAEALPEVLPQGVSKSLDHVYYHGGSYAGVEIPLTIAQPSGDVPKRHYFDFIYQAHPEAGQPTRVSVFACDVTEKVLARRQREAQRAEWQHLFEQAPVAIAVLRGPRYVIELANPAICALWGRLPQQVLGQPLFEALPEAASQYQQHLAAVLATGTPYVTLEQPITLHRNGRADQLYVDFVYQPLREANGQVTDLLVVVTDVSEQVQSRQRVHHLNEELRVTNEELHANNHELAQAQQELRQLNQELEGRVAAGVLAAQRTRDAAERQRQRLASFFQQAPAAICVLDGPELVFELANPGYQRQFPGRMLLGRPLAAALPELVEQPMYQWLRQVYSTGVAHEGHEVPVLLYPTEDDPPEQRYFDCVYQARHNGLGQIDGVLVFALDVTERVLARQRIEALQAEALAAAERLAQERETFYQIFEHTPAIVTLMWGPEHRFAYVNRSFEQLFPGRLVHNVPLTEALPEVAAQGFVAILDQVYQSGESYVANEQLLTIRQPDGPSRELYLNLAYQPYHENGQTLGVSVFSYDVTEQVQARRQREAAQAQLQLVFEQAPVALALLQGPTYIAAVANLAICELWGCNPAQPIGRPLFEVLPETATQGLREILDEACRSGKPVMVQERPADLLRAGRLETVYFNFVYQPLADAQGEFSSVVVVATDVTAGVRSRQQANQALRDLRVSNTQLTRTNADLDTFIYTASHDLKAPIANIEGLLLLLRKQLPAEARQAGIVPRVLDMMQGAIERFQVTIAQLTDLAKLQHAHTQPAEEVNLPAVVEAVRLDLAPLLTEAQAELVINLDSCTTVSFAPQHLRSIVYNLLSNAIKYRHPHRPLVVHVRCHHTPKASVLEVQDNGLGLTPEQQSKLFSMFRRLHDHVPGSGVGLHMVKRILENAGGSIEVRSQADVGSTFTVSFPS